MYPNSGLLPILNDLIARSYVVGRIGEYEFNRSTELVRSPVVSILEGRFSFLDLVEYQVRSLIDAIYGATGAIRWEEYSEFLISHADVWLGRSLHVVAVLSA